MSQLVSECLWSPSDTPTTVKLAQKEVLDGCSPSTSHGRVHLWHGEENNLPSRARTLDVRRGEENQQRRRFRKSGPTKLLLYSTGPGPTS